MLAICERLGIIGDSFTCKTNTMSLMSYPDKRIERAETAPATNMCTIPLETRMLEDGVNSGTVHACIDGIMSTTNQPMIDPVVARLALMKPGERYVLSSCNGSTVVIERASVGRVGRIVRESRNGFSVMCSITF